MPSPVLAPALQPGATIAFVSLSARLNDVFPAAVSRASALLSSRGYEVRVLFNQPDSGIQSSISNRLAEFRAALLDPRVTAVICTIGGETFTELLPALVADTALHAAVRAHPKIVVGYSDMTGLHWFLHAMTGLRSFYGPSAIPELGTADPPDDAGSPRAFCLGSLLDVVARPRPLGDVPRSPTYAPALPDFFREPASAQVQNLGPAPAWRWLRGGAGRGRLFGGCLTTVARLNGVRAVAPDWRGRIVFLETAVRKGEALGELRTAFADLVAQGVFDEAAGLVVGRPSGYETGEALDRYAGVITELLCEGRLAEAENQFPILFNVDIGHTTPMVTLPYDALAALDSDSDRFTLLEAGVVE